MSKRTFILIFTLFTVTVVLAMIALYNPSSYDKAVIAPTPTIQLEPLAQTELGFGTISTSTINSSSGAKTVYSVPIAISAKSNKINIVQLELSYDSNILTQISLTPGTFFPKPVSFLNQIDEKNGRISYAIGTSPNDPGIQGKGIAAVLTFQAKSSLQGKTNISFLPKTLVRADGINQSVLKEAISAQIVIGENMSFHNRNVPPL